MRKHFFTALACACLPFVAFSQAEVEWAKTYQGNKTDKAFGVAPAPNGGLAVLGRETLSATDKNGEKLWETKLPYNAKDHNNLTALKSGGYLLTGYTNSKNGDAELILTRVDAKGKISLQKTYSDPDYTLGYCVTETSDGNYIIGGWRYNDTKDGAYVAKIDANGKLLWDKFYDKVKGEEYFTKVTPDKNGGAVFVGSTTNGFRDSWVAAIDKSGNIQWENNYGSAKAHEDGYIIESTKDGYIVVSSASITKGDKQVYNALITKIDLKGAKVWEKTYGAEGLCEFYGIAPTLDGNFILAGTHSKTTASDANVWLMQIDKSGNQKWESFYGGSNEDEVSSICLTTDGMFAAAGFTEYMVGEADDEDDASFVSNVWALKFKEPLDLDLGEINLDELELELDLDLNLDDVNWEEIDAMLEDRPIMPKVWVVLVGVSDYSDAQNAEGWSDLRYCHSDAKLLYDFVTSPKGGSLPKEQITMLTNSTATKANILKTCKEVYAKAFPQDLIIFYFSGHGGPNVFAAHDDVVEHTALQEIITNSKAGKRLCIADACYSGSWNANKAASKNPLTDEQMKEVYYDRLRSVSNNMALFMSSSKNQTSLELGAPHQQSLFTLALIQGLGGEADEDGDKVVSIQELYIYVKFLVNSYSRERGSSQTPQLQGFFDSGMPIGVVR